MCFRGYWFILLHSTDYMLMQNVQASCCVWHTDVELRSLVFSRQRPISVCYTSASGVNKYISQAQLKVDSQRLSCSVSANLKKWLTRYRIGSRIDNDQITFSSARCLAIPIKDAKGWIEKRRWSVDCSDGLSCCLLPRCLIDAVG